MKKVLMAIVAVAIAMSFAGASFAEEQPVVKGKETVKTTATGTVEKEKAKITTEDAVIKEKAKTVTTATPTGSTSVTKEKIVVTPKDDPSAKKIVKILQVSDNNTADKSDDTITFINVKNEKITMPLHQDVKMDHLKPLVNKEVVYSTYKIGEKEYFKDFALVNPTTPDVKTPAK